MKKLLLVAGSSLVLLLVWDWGFIRGRKLTAENIMSVRPGMTMDQVRSVLGDPIEERSKGPAMFFCRCNPEKTCSEPSSITFTYTRKPHSRNQAYFLPFDMSYPMLWVHFNSRGKVKEVYVKKYTGMERRPIYTANLSPCDSTDRTIERVAWAESDAVARRRLEEFF